MRFFDLHCDTLYRCLEEDASLCRNNFHISLQKGNAFENWGQCFAAWIPDELRGSDAVSLVDRAIAKFEAELEANKHFMQKCTSAKNLKDAEKARKCASILALEGGAALDGKISELYKVATRGVKIITLTWNGHCELGDGCGVLNPLGITAFGKEAVKKMQELGVFVDVSHASDKLFYDVVNVSQKPIIATHSNSRAVCGHKRNLTDEQFRLIKDSGGIVGINFCKDFLNERGAAGFDDILAHVEHFLQLGGEHTICMGSDFDGADMPSGISGIESIGSLRDYFAQKGYGDDILEDIFYNNAHRFFRENM